MKHFKVLAVAYWNNSVDNYSAPSTKAIQNALKEGLITPSQVQRYSQQEKETLKQIGYTDQELDKTKTIYHITDKGLTLFKTTQSYKTMNPNINR